MYLLTDDCSNGRENRPEMRLLSVVPGKCGTVTRPNYVKAMALIRI